MLCDLMCMNQLASKDYTNEICRIKGVCMLELSKLNFIRREDFKLCIRSTASVIISNKYYRDSD